MMRTTKAAVIAWLSRLPLFIAFIGLYVALDVASFIHPLHGLNITPWNPAPALGLVLLIQIGRQDGMHSMDESLLHLLNHGHISLVEAKAYARDPEYVEDQYRGK